ncbi:MAG TPA: AAA family ATPase [Anaerolineaceae bacterium]|nr:AAA family ATPase [Anaerolineaceae bacterium]
MDFTERMILRSIELDRSLPLPKGFPFSVPVIRSLTRLEFTSRVTFFIGENGCGKSTLLEAIAGAADSITVGSMSVTKDHSLSGVRRLSSALRLTWSKKLRRGFFMRSEDFFGYVRNLAETTDGLRSDLEDVEREYQDRSPTAQAFARSAYQNELSALERDYGEDLDAHSHGESYLQLFQARFHPEGLYLMDEPEAPLSPLRQLAFLSILKRMVDDKAQFIIATHSPIIMAFPGATILNFDGGEIHATRYEDVEHVQITKSFLDNPDRYLRHLMEG